MIRGSYTYIHMAYPTHTPHMHSKGISALANLRLKTLHVEQSQLLACKAKLQSRNIKLLINAELLSALNHGALCQWSEDGVGTADCLSMQHTYFRHRCWVPILQLRSTRSAHHMQLSLYSFSDEGRGGCRSSIATDDSHFCEME